MARCSEPGPPPYRDSAPARRGAPEHPHALRAPASKPRAKPSRLTAARPRHSSTNSIKIDFRSHLNLGLGAPPLFRPLCMHETRRTHRAPKTRLYGTRAWHLPIFKISKRVKPPTCGLPPQWGALVSFDTKLRPPPGPKTDFSPNWSRFASPSEPVRTPTPSQIAQTRAVRPTGAGALNTPLAVAKPNSQN